MDTDVIRAKKLLESKGYVIEKKLFDIDESDVTPLNEFVEVYGSEYAWEETLEESLYDYEEDRIDEARVNDQEKVFEPGDIIMTRNYYSPSSHQRRVGDPHKILIITSKQTSGGKIYYKGFLLSSQVHKANIRGKYPNNIYIQNYSTILASGVPADKEAIIRVDDIVEFTNRDLSFSGTKKGVASQKFIDFINTCYFNYSSGRSNDNFKLQWLDNTKEDSHGQYSKEA